MKDSDLPDQVKITPTDMYHPELTYLQGELIVSFQGSYAVTDIDKLKASLGDVRKLNNELKGRYNCHIPNQVYDRLVSEYDDVHFTERLGGHDL